VLVAKLMQKVLQDNLTSESTQLQSKPHSKKNQHHGRAKG
jgi:hypothetical protein